MRIERLFGSRSVQIALVLITAAWLGNAFLTHAWIGEDAHITMRTVDNFVNGHGLRWNVDERVQTYTHPLWLLLITPFYYFTRELYFTLLWLCLPLSVGAYVVIASRWRADPLVMLACVFIPYALSRSFVLYGTSGFENPLTLFLLAVFSVGLLRAEGRETPWLTLSLVAALGCVNRLDSLVLYGPALAALVVARWREVRWGRLLAGLTPLFVWLAFSLFYYGFLFPNTAYAKLPPSVPRNLYLINGVRYVANFLRVEWAAGSALLIGSVASVVWFVRWLADRSDERALLLVALGSGLLTSIAYVVWVGGDFLSGRFLVAPALVAIVICASSARPFVSWLAGVRWGWRLAVVATAVLTLVAVNRFAVQVEASIKGKPIRRQSLARVMLTEDWRWRPSHLANYLRHRGAAAVRRLNERGMEVQPIRAIGMAGVVAMRVRLVDQLAIGDPLLARLAPVNPRKMRPGHNPRKYPEGYIEARATGSLAGMDDALREYYRPLRLIISGPLWSPERLATIVRFNLGQYDAFRDDYERRGGGITRLRIPESEGEGAGDDS